MKIKIEAKELSSMLKCVSSALPKGSTSPILQCVKIDCEDNKMKVSASNLEATIIKSGECAVLESGTICVHGKTLIALVGRIKDFIEIETDGTVARFKSGKMTFELELADDTLYPEVKPSETASETIVVSENVIDSVFTKLRDCVSKDETRAVLTAICLRVKGDKYVFAATDGRKVGEILIEKPSGATFTGELLFPNVTIEPVLKNLTHIQDADITIKVTQRNKIEYEFKDGTQVLTSKLEYKFPEYEKAFNGRESSKAIEFEKKELAEALKTCMLASEQTMLKTAMELDGTENATFVSSTRGEVNAQVLLPYKENNISVDGRVAFNPAYMLAILSAIDGDTVRIAMLIDQIGKSPLFISGSSPNESYLLMPLRS